MAKATHQRITSSWRNCEVQSWRTEVCWLIQEYNIILQSSMRTVAKKDPNKVHLVFDLQDLNSVTTRNFSLPPNIEDFAEGFVGHAMYGSTNLFFGFDPNFSGRISSYDCLPLIYRSTSTMYNAVQEFQKCMVYGLSTRISHFADPFVNHTGIKGPDSNHNNVPIPSNPHIQGFEIWVCYDTWLNSSAIYCSWNYSVWCEDYSCYLWTDHCGHVGLASRLAPWKRLVLKILSGLPQSILQKFKVSFETDIGYKDFCL